MWYYCWCMKGKGMRFSAEGIRRLSVRHVIRVNRTVIIIFGSIYSKLCVKIQLVSSEGVRILVVFIHYKKCDFYYSTGMSKRYSESWV